MWRLWNSVTKGFRSTAARGYRDNTIIDSEASSFLSVRPPHPSVQDANITHSTSPPCSSKPLREVPVAEAVGVGSALAVGWHLCHNKRKKQTTSLGNGSLFLDALMKIAFAQPESQQIKLNVVGKTTVKAVTATKPENRDVVLDTVTGKSTDETTSIPEMMDTVMKDLVSGENLVIADLQNQAGVELIAAAQRGGNTGEPELDKILGTGNPSVCQREAFRCFKEASKLGSIKGKFNLGLCYEQGIGVRPDLRKAAAYYEEAAQQGHAAAQYNLGLLYYNGQVPGQVANKSRAIQLWRLSAREGLEQAWTALLSLVDSEQSTKDWEASTTSLNLLDDISTGLESTSFVMSRKTRSEPHDLCAMN